MVINENVDPELLGGVAMSKRVCLLTTGGVGDILQGIQAAHYISQKIGKNNVDIRIYCRDEIWTPLNWLAGNLYNLIHQIELSDDRIIKMMKICDYFGPQHDETLCVWPDTLWKFWNYDYGHPVAVRSHRLFPFYHKPQGKLIYCALSSTTENYLYHNTGALLRQLGKTLPEFTLYCPLPPSWNSKAINYGNLDNLCSDVILDTKATFIEAIEKIKTAVYGICLDNGPSHILFHLGVPRLLLDPWLSNTGYAFMSRWREDIKESIDIHQSPAYIAKIVRTNLDIPETTLLPRDCAFEETNWKNKLLIKY